MTKIRIALAALALGAPAIAAAVPVTVDFTVTTTMSRYGGAIDPGYQAGVVGTGYFTYDDAFPEEPTDSGGMRALDLSLSWMGATWDETLARIGWLSFNLDGSLGGFLIGGWSEGDCGIGCVPTGSTSPNDFWVGTDYGDFSSLVHVKGRAGAIYASTQWSVRPTPVPEPGPAALMGAGLLGLWAARRRTGHRA